MNNYNSLTDAMDDLRKKGYGADFELGKKNFGMHYEDVNATFDPTNFRVDEVHMFRGDSVPGKNSILFAITSSTGVKGILVDEYAVTLTAFR